MSDCTPPTGVRWATPDGRAKLKLNVLLSSTPSLPFLLFKKEGDRFNSHGLEMGPTECWGRVLAVKTFLGRRRGVAGARRSCRL